uniref:Uncharacterized protein n=2 Tax=Anguilla anguilla TaxID=7936 RepID=A0A0E9QVP4_ANGAN
MTTAKCVYCSHSQQEDLTVVMFTICLLCRSLDIYISSNPVRLNNNAFPSKNDSGPIHNLTASKSPVWYHEISTEGKLCVISKTDKQHYTGLSL